MTKARTPALKIVFAGTPDFAAVHLQALLADGHHRIVAAYTQPDRPAGRGKKLQPSAVKQVAEEHGLPVFQPDTLKSEAEQARLQELKPDLMVVVAYGLLLPKPVLDTPHLGCINVHASLLPRWRGAAPIQRAIEAGDGETGITVMQMDEGLDTGDMLLKVSCPITAQDTSGTLHDRLADLGPGALLAALDQLAEGTATPDAQDDGEATYAHKILKDQARIDWHQPAAVIERRIRAFNPAPVCWTMLAGERLRIWGAVMATPHFDAIPGTIIDTSPEGIHVATGEGTLLISDIQLPGKRRMAAAEMLKSRATLFPVGTGFEN